MRQKNLPQGPRLRNVYFLHISRPTGSHASMHPIVCGLSLILRHPWDMVRNSSHGEFRHRSVVTDSGKSSLSSRQRTCLIHGQYTNTQDSSGISQKSIRSISAGARWPMQSISCTNHRIPRRSRGSPPLLQLLHRRVRLPSVFDQNHGVARPGPRNEE
jgi:hypothetical protein